MQQKPLVIALSAVAVSLVVHRSRTRSHRARAASDSQVTDGQVVTVDRTVDGNSVDATDVQSDGQNTNGTDVEGTVQSIDATARTLTISADDSEQSGSTLTVNVPASGQDQGDNNGDNHNSAEQVSAAQQSDPNLATSHNGESFAQFWATDPNNPVNWRPAFRPAGGADRP